VGVGYHYFLRDVAFTLCDTWGPYVSATALLYPGSSTDGEVEEEDPFASASSSNARETALQCGALASRLLTYLIKHAHDEDAEILKDNIRSIGALIQLWSVKPTDGTQSATINGAAAAAAPAPAAKSKSAPSHTIGSHRSSKSDHDSQPLFLSQLALGSVMSLLTVEAAPTGGAHAAKTSRGTEGVKKRLAGLSIVQVTVE
jgi:hypothetical protein